MHIERIDSILTLRWRFIMANWHSWTLYTTYKWMFSTEQFKFFSLPASKQQQIHLKVYIPIEWYYEHMNCSKTVNESEKVEPKHHGIFLFCEKKLEFSQMNSHFVRKPWWNSRRNVSRPPLFLPKKLQFHMVKLPKNANSRYVSYKSVILWTKNPFWHQSKNEFGVRKVGWKVLF